MIAFKNVADGNGRNGNFIAYLVGKRHLEHAAVHRLLRLAYLPGGTIDHVSSGILEKTRNLYRIVRRKTSRYPVMRGDAHAHRQVLRPCSAHGRKNFKRVAAAIRQTTTILIRAPVRERRNKAGHQIAVSAVKFQPVKSGSRGAHGG